MPTVLIIDKDINFLKKLSHKLNEFGYDSIVKSQLEDPDELLQIQKPVDSMVLNFELENMEGLAVYSYLKNSKLFEKTSFAFVADDNNIFSLLSNIPLDRSIILNKEDNFSNLVNEIINNIPLITSTNRESIYSIELTSKLENISVSNLLNYFKITRFSGRVVVSSKNEFAILVFEWGEIDRIFFKDLEKMVALNELLSWTSGEIRIERKRLEVGNFEKFQQTGDKNNSLSLNDLISDLFYFLHSFLDHQIENNVVRTIFLKNFSELDQSNLIVYMPELEEKVLLKKTLTNSDLKPMVILFKKIFLSAQKIQKEITFQELEDYLNEIRPYLENINFYSLYHEVNLSQEDIKLISEKSLQISVSQNV